MASSKLQPADCNAEQALLRGCAARRVYGGAVLYRPEAFEALTDESWDEIRVRAAIRAIVDDADRAFHPHELWPADEWDAWGSALPLTTLYAGAAGMLWALDVLQRRGQADTTIDLQAASERALEAWRAASPTEQPTSLLSGETGILVVAARLAPNAGLADDLLDRVRANHRHEANELMFGAAGTMLAASEMLDRTGEKRWADAWHESADELWRRRDTDGLWTQRLWGEDSRGLGPPHGAVGNAAALLQGGDLLAESRREALARETAAVLARTAVVEDGLANWPTAEGRDLNSRDGQIRLQWDYGAPGIVVTAAAYLDEELLLAGAGLTWRAGPPGPEKGYGICHGTAGNGYALLKTFERTEDERWLGRARRFAMHAVGQLERAHTNRGRGRYSLWTGDVGVALFAADCLDGRARYPIVDGWD